MNPDTGKLHAIAELAGVERIAKGERGPTVDDELVRATEKIRVERERSTEPPPGTEVPKDWPRFRIGDRLGPIKGWWFELVYADVEAQKLVIQPLEPTKTTVERRAGKRKRRRKKSK